MFPGTLVSQLPFGKGHISAFSHAAGILPVLKHKLKKPSITLSDFNNRRDLLLKRSIPGAFFDFKRFTDERNSSIEIVSGKRSLRSGWIIVSISPQITPSQVDSGLQNYVNHIESHKNQTMV